MPESQELEQVDPPNSLKNISDYLRRERFELNHFNNIDFGIWQPEKNPDTILDIIWPDFEDERKYVHYRVHEAAWDARDDVREGMLAFEYLLLEKRLEKGMTIGILQMSHTNKFIVKNLQKQLVKRGFGDEFGSYVSFLKSEYCINMF